VKLPQSSFLGLATIGLVIVAAFGVIVRIQPVATVDVYDSVLSSVIATGLEDGPDQCEKYGGEVWSKSEHVPAGGEFFGKTSTEILCVTAGVIVPGYQRSSPLEPELTCDDSITPPDN